MNNKKNIDTLISNMFTQLEYYNLPKANETLLKIEKIHISNQYQKQLFLLAKYRYFLITSDILNAEKIKLELNNKLLSDDLQHLFSFCHAIHLYDFLNKHNEALKLLISIQSDLPFNFISKAEYYYQIALINGHLNDYMNMIINLNIAENLYAKNHNWRRTKHVLRNLAIAFEATNLFDMALKYNFFLINNYDHPFDKNNDLAVLYFNRGFIYMRKTNFEKANQYFSLSLQGFTNKNKDYAKCFYFFAESLFKLHHDDSLHNFLIAEQLTKEFHCFPQNCLAHYYLILIQKNKNEALNFLENNLVHIKKLCSPHDLNYIYNTILTVKEGDSRVI